MLTLFRRAKLRLDAVSPEVLRNAEEQGFLVARVNLTDTKGNPACASVGPSFIEWSAASADPAALTRSGPSRWFLRRQALRRLRRHAPRRRTSHMVPPISSADTVSSQPPSVSWNRQNRAFGCTDCSGL